MKRNLSHHGYTPLEKLAAASGRGSMYMSSGSQTEATRRQQKHELLLTFMANANAEKKRPAPAKPKLLATLLSLFF